MTKQQAIARLRALISETWSAHRDTTGYDYNECEEEECTWCEDTRKSLEALEAADEPEAKPCICPYCSQPHGINRCDASEAPTDPDVSAALVEMQLADDLRIFGSAFYRMVEGCKVRVRPQDVWIDRQGRFLTGSSVAPEAVSPVRTTAEGT